jgi:ubiquitin carboxyl-terminal hydrolase L5
MIDPPTPIQAVAGQRRRSSVIQFDPSTRSNSLEGASRSSPETNSSSYTPADKSARCKRNQDVYDRQSGGGPEELTPTKRPGLRIKQTPSKSTTQPMEEAMKPLTDDERRNWKGWVELESDPVSNSRTLLFQISIK